MPPVSPIVLLMSLVAPVAPVSKAPSTIASPTATKGGAAAEAPETSRTSPPAKVDETLRVVLSRLGEDPEVTPAEQAQVESIAKSLRAGDTKAARSQWKKLVAAHRTRTGSIDVDALLQWVLRQSYLETTDDLKDAATKAAAINAAKKKIREHLERVRAEVAAAAPGTVSITLPTLVVCKKCEPGRAIVRAGGKKTLSPAQWEAYAAELEEKLQTLGEDAQLANVDLQDALQKQQQTMQMMSNLSKSLHDTAKAVINKMRG